MLRLLPILVWLLLLAACGGGSASPDTGTGGGGLLPNPGPQIALLMCNGHSPLPNYLATATGPQLEGALLGAGYTLQTSYFTDDLGGGTPGGYTDLVTKLQQIRDDWISGRSDPTRIVIVGHSHGCVRSHAALRAVADCPIRLLVDLDGSSAGWSIVTHGPENDTIGGAPEGAYNINATITCAAFPGIGSAPPPFDLEDVVFAHEHEAYEVRSADMLLDPANLTQLIPYDERWNARPDGTTDGLTCHYSGLSHFEAGAPGVTLTAVQAWMLARLAAD